MKIRVGIKFYGIVSGDIGKPYETVARRTIEVPENFTIKEAYDASHLALYYPDLDSPAYEKIFIKQVTFN